MMTSLSLIGFRRCFFVCELLLPYSDNGGGGTFDATQDLNPLLLTKDCVYSVLSS